MKGTDNSVRVQKTIGSRIRAARDFAKLSRTEFAELLLKNEEYPEVTPRKGGNEITTPTEKLVNRIKQWERGENPVGLEFIPAICNVLHCDVGYLFGNYEERNHVVADIAHYTGLSELNINRLIAWQNQFDFHYQNVGNICIESAYKSMLDYMHLDIARLKMKKLSANAPIDTHQQDDNSQLWKELYKQLQTEEEANDFGYTLLQHKDAVRFYARSISRTLEQYLEEVYTNGID